MSAFEKWSVWITTVLTGATGVGYFWAKYLVESTDPFAVANHPLEPWFLKAHIVVSPFLLFALGMILVRHIWQHYRLGIRWGRRSGIATALFLLPMVVTGYLVQAVTGRGWLEAVAIAHIVTGAVYLVGLAAHQVAIQLMRPPPGERRVDRGRRRRRRPGGARRDAPGSGTARKGAAPRRERRVGADGARPG